MATYIAAISTRSKKASEKAGSATSDAPRRRRRCASPAMRNNRRCSLYYGMLLIVAVFACCTLSTVSSHQDGTGLNMADERQKLLGAFMRRLVDDYKNGALNERNVIEEYDGGGSERPLGYNRNDENAERLFTLNRQLEHIPSSAQLILNAKRYAVPLATSYNKRASAALPYSGGIYGKRDSSASTVPFSGGIYGKRASGALPYSGGIYGKRKRSIMESVLNTAESADIGLRSRGAITNRAASVVPLNGGLYGRRRR